MNFKLILMLLLSSLAVLFIAQNSAVVEVTFMFWIGSISSAVLILLTLLFGFILGWFTQSYLRYRKSQGVIFYSR